MQAVNNLCKRAMFLQKGKLINIGPVDKVVNSYLGGIQQNRMLQEWDDERTAPGNDVVRVRSVELVPHVDEGKPIDIRTPLTLNFEFHNFQEGINLVTGIHLFTMSGECIFDVSSKPREYSAGVIRGTCTIPGNFLNDGSYYISIIFVRDTSVEVFYLEFEKAGLGRRDTGYRIAFSSPVD